LFAADTGAVLHCIHTPSVTDNEVLYTPGHSLLVLQSETLATSLSTDIKTQVATDGFWGGVLTSVQDSDDNFSRDFFLDANEILCYQRPEDSRARVCVPYACREAVLRAAHGDSVLAGHPGIDRTIAAVSHSYYWPGLHADVGHFVRSCQTCAASKSSNA